MHETLIESPHDWEASDGIRASALRAEAWAGEPFLRPDDDSAASLRPGSAVRRALDDALAEMDAGLGAPSSEWKVRYALMLGLERVLSEKPPHLASGTELRRHQVDALAGMLTELIAAVEKQNGNGNGDDQRLRRSRGARRGRGGGRGGHPGRARRGRRARRPAAAAARGPRRRAALPLPPSDRLGQDDRRRRASSRRPAPRAC